MNRVFIGYDHRQPISYNVLQQSILMHSSQPVSITPLVINQLPMKRTGLTPFTFSRFIVPYLCDFKGKALFLDADMLLDSDISELFDLFDDRYAIQIIKNSKKFEWASVMLFNCEHPSNKILTPEYIDSTKEKLHAIGWLKDEEIGSLPEEWNRLVGYDKTLDDAKLIHYTQGVPCFPETQTSPLADKWFEIYNYSNFAVPWAQLMGTSVHAANVNGTPVPLFLIEVRDGQAKPAKGQEEQLFKLVGKGNSNVNSGTNEITNCG